MKDNIVLFGGSFDPIHQGHILMAKYAHDLFDAQVIFILAKRPRWKNVNASDDKRLAMLKIALKDLDENDYSYSEYELTKDEEINYSIDTIKYFLDLYPKRKIYFLIGADQVNKFDDWKEGLLISKLVQIIFFPRVNLDIDEKIVKKYQMIKIVDKKIPDISSTEIRQLEKIDEIEGVREYIENHNLYYMDNILNKYIIDDHRYQHSLSVARLALAIAISNNLPNKENYYIAALLHDLGKTKYFDSDQMQEIMFKYYPQYIDLPFFTYHQFVGHYIAKEMIGIKNEHILRAIEFHCTGIDEMDEIGMITYLSDKIEPTRGFDSTWLISSALKNYYQGFIDTLIDNRKYLLNHHKDIYNRLTQACFTMYLNKGEK